MGAPRGGGAAADGGRGRRLTHEARGAAIRAAGGGDPWYDPVVPSVSCPSCGLSRPLPAALLRAGARDLRCPACGARVTAAALGSRAPPSPEDRWRQVPAWQAVALGAGAALLAWSAATHGAIAAVVAGADLVFHEAGHPILSVFGSRFLTYLGGAIGQLAFPAVAAVAFARRRDAGSFGAALLWLGFNVVEIGRYAADGRVRALPLLAPDEDAHDWWNLLGMMGLRDRAEPIGALIAAAGWATMIAAPLWVAWRWWRARAAAAPALE